MPEPTDLQRVAQWAKSSNAPSDVYNAACRVLDAPDELVELRARLAEYENALNWQTSCLACSKVLDSSIADHDRAEQAEAIIERVKAFAKELRTYCSPMGIASVYADTLETVLDGAESHGDGRTPQTLGTGEGHEAGEAQGAAQ